AAPGLGLLPARLRAVAGADGLLLRAPQTQRGVRGGRVVIEQALTKDREAAAPRHIAVFGAGAVGSVLAARLARAGQRVSIVARGAHVAAVRAQGLRLIEPQGESLQHVQAEEQ